MSIRIGIVGSRDFPSQYLVERVVYELPKDAVIVSGGARGVDSWAAATALHHGRETVVHKPDWGKHGKVAGFIRNNEIVRDCDLVVAFYDGKSRGTKHTISLCSYLGVPCVVVKTA